jgi:hypothetical protein
MPATAEQEVIVDVVLTYYAPGFAPNRGCNGAFFEIPDIRAIIMASSPEHWRITGLEFSYLKGRYPHQTRHIHSVGPEFPLYSALVEQIQERCEDDIVDQIADDLGYSYRRPRTIDDAQAFGAGEWVCK